MRAPFLFTGKLTSVSLSLLLLAGAGCRSIGPQTIPRDRHDYSYSISESWKRQTLLNIVKLRYLDPPIFVDVGQIVAGYSVEKTMSAGGSVPQTTTLGGDTATFGGALKWTDRPTITYTPLTGDKFVRALMTPLPPVSVFATIESGWPADAILFATVSRLNGLRNQEATVEGFSPAEPRFLRALQLMGQVQEAGAVSLRIEQDPQKHQTTVISIRAKDVSEETLARSRELRELLGLAPDATEFKLVSGSLAANDQELALKTRSMMHILGLMAAQVEVPPEDVARGRAAPGLIEADKGGTRSPRLAWIRSGTSKPTNAYVMVEYRDRWYWIDDDDLKSKRSFAFIMMLFTLTDTGDKPGLPVLTIPAQ